MKQKLRFKVLYLLIARSMLVLLLSFVFLSSYGQGRTVTGVINDENGTSIPGVNVIIKGTTTGTVTDLDGKFKINVPGDESVLSFSFIGYIPQDITVGQQTAINVILKEEVKQLNEVVVIGYGVQKKSDLTGAVASVKSEDIVKLPNTGLDAALQGRAAGVQVSPETGAPGTNVVIRIRGISTITTVNGVNQGGPLWIVDGVPAGSNSVNMNDVESVEILKDASSAAIYGANGGSGVVLVTTKKGKAGKTQVEVNYYHGFQDVAKNLDMATGPQYGATFTEQEALRGLNTFTYTGNLDYKKLPTYDYQSLVLQPAPMDNLDLSVSGGTEKFKGYLALGLVNQLGIFKSSSFEKFNFRINSDYTANNWLKLGETMSFTQSERDGFQDWQYENQYQSPLMQALQILPYVAPYDSAGNFVPKHLGQTGDPMVAVDLLHQRYSTYEGHGSFFIIIEPVKRLTFESHISGSLTFNNNYNFTPTYNYGPGAGESNSHSQIYRQLQQYNDYNWQNLVKYNNKFLNDFNFSALAGYEVNGSGSMDISGTRYDLLGQTPEMWYFNASQDITTAGVQLAAGGGSKSTGFSYLGRLSLDYKDKYLAQINFRRDYSSKFGPDNRFGNFPGYSLGWKFSEEDFIKNALPIISFGKLRYAWGNSGNNAIRDYAYYATVAVLQHWQYSFDNTTNETVGAAPNVLANQAIHWEDIRTQDLGLDLALLDNRLSITVDKFNRHNIGMLVPTTIPGYAGWTVRDGSQESGNIDPRPILNVGKITNKGWEFSLGWKGSIGKFKYALDANYTYVTTEATDLGADSVRYTGGTTGVAGYLCRTATGGEIGEFYGYKVDRLFTVNDPVRLIKRGLKWVPVITDQPYTTKVDATDPTKIDTTFAQPSAQAGDFKWVDVNHDGKISTLDQTNLGNPNPKNLVSLNMNFEFGMFDLTLFWQGTFGNKIFNATKYYGVVSSGDYNWSEDYVNNHYQATDVVAKDAEGNIIATFPKNTSGKYPRIDYFASNGNFTTMSDFYVEDGSYVRLKNIQLGITLPSKWANKAGLSSFKIYVGVKNLLTITKYSGMDPEVPQNDPLTAGIDQAAYPQARSVIIGANIKF